MPSFILCLLLLGFAQASGGAVPTWKGTVVIKANVGDDVNLDCTMPGAIGAVSLWHTDNTGRVKKLSNSSKVLQSGSNFTLLNIPLNDFGMYECKVGSGGVKRTIKKFNIFHVHPGPKPVLEIHPREKEIIIGETAVFICVTTQMGGIHWRKVGLKNPSFNIRLMPIAKRHSIATSHSGGFYQSSLIFKNATLADKGLYECGVAGQRQYARLFVGTPQCPRVSKVLPGKEVSVSVGDTLDIECMVDGFPRPSVIWVKGITHITPCDLATNEGCVGNQKFFKNGPTGLTIMKMAYPKDHGPYLCIATNECGTDSGTINVDVRVAPKMGSNEAEYWKSKGSAKDIRCNVEFSNPPPSFVWKSALSSSGPWRLVANDQVLYDAGVRITKSGPLTSVLHIPKGIDLPDILFFICEASNKEGKDLAAFELHII